MNILLQCVTFKARNFDEFLKFPEKSDKFGLTVENQLETELNIKRLKNEVKLSNL